MKKIIFAGLVILLVMSFVTCDDFLQGDNEKKVEYTDVVYSKDGSRITVYLDGVGVPKTAAQRAMSTDLAKIAYDFIEVIFVSGTTRARNSWELGQSAGISGVKRGAGSSATDIKYDNSGTDVALMFVGRKDSKLLLGIGKIGGVNGSDDATADGQMPSPIVAVINDDTKKVTFYIEAVKTGLRVDTTVPPFDSFDLVGPVAGSLPAGTANSWTSRAGHSMYLSLGTSPAVKYPLYNLPQRKDFTPALTADPVQHAKYTFYGAASTYAAFIKYASKLKVERRLPRYLDGGVYYAPEKSNYDIKSTVEVRTGTGGYVSAKDTVFVPTIPLAFTVKGNGIFSFFIEAPVYMYNDGDATNSGPKAEIWKIRTGFGSELYSLDDGDSGAGGCVLIGVGNTGADWIDIEWKWLDDTP